MHKSPQLSVPREALPASIPGILDKEPWHQETEASVVEAEHTGEALSVLYMDMDYFKEVNDILGHIEGDRVIAEFRDIVQVVACLVCVQEIEGFPLPSPNLVALSEKPEPKPVDIAHDYIDATPGHTGGDEFTILAKTDAAGAAALGARVREAFAAYLNLPENQALKDIGVNLSIGMATYRRGMACAEFLREADEAMYTDKLAHLPILSQEQKAALQEARLLLEAAHIRLRDVPKYFRLPF